MFEIVEQVFEPIRLPIADGAKFKPGDIIGLCYDKGVHCKTSNSLNPYGMVAGLDETHNLVFIVSETAIIKTDNFDKNATYTIGDFLYSNNNGTLTTNKEEETSLLLGNVVDAISGVGGYIEINWI